MWKPRLPLTVVAFAPGSLGQAGMVRASPLTRCPGNTRGSQAVERVYQAQFNCIRKAGKRRVWYPVHMLHGATRRTGGRNLHGPGDDRKNIIVAEASINRQMYASVEWAALTRVYDLNQVLWYESRVDSYFPGDEFFAKSITVRYGLFNTNSGTEGPQLDSQTFAGSETPPLCPASLPAVAPPVAQPPADFQSTISICLRQLTSHVFPVPKGGLRVTLRANWLPGPGAGPAACPASDYLVQLEQEGLIFGFNQRGKAVSVPADKGITLTWKRLEKDNYRIVISTSGHDPSCCLKGDISVFTFDAPRLRRGETWA